MGASLGRVEAKRGREALGRVLMEAVKAQGNMGQFPHLGQALVRASPTQRMPLPIEETGTCPVALVPQQLGNKKAG